MSADDKQDSNSPDSAVQRHSRKRRKILAGLTAGTAVAAAGKVAPSTWIKPVMDATILPAHAQSTLMMLTAQLTLNADDDFGGNVTVPMVLGPGDHVIPMNGIDGDDPQFTIAATVSPPQAIPVTMHIDADSNMDFGSFSGDETVMSDPSTGAAQFSTLDSDDNDDGGILRYRISAPGFSDVIINLTMTP